MIQFKTISRTVIAAAALAVIASAANAGTVSATSRNVAKEAFGTAVTAATVVNTAATGITYTFSTPGGIVINPGGTIYITLTPTGGKLAQTASLLLTVPTTAGGTLTGTNTTATVNASGEIIIVLNNSGTTNTVLGVGATVNVGAPVGNANNGGSGLVTVTNAVTLASGTNVSVVGKVGVSSGGGELETTTTTAATLLTASTAVNAAVANSAGFAVSPETDKIDLTSSPISGSNLITGATTSAIETLGSVTFTDVVPVANELAFVAAANVPVNTASTTAFDGTASYDLVLATGGFTAGTTYSINSAPTCVAGSTIGSTQTNTPAGAVTAATTKVNLTTAIVVRPVTGVPLYLCATYPNTGAIALNQLSVSGKLNKFSASFVDVPVAATPLYDLVYNGSQVDVLNYIPAAVTGYIQTVRVVNTGNVAATPTIALINEATGVAASAVSVGISIPAGGALRLSQATIEGLIGTQAANVRPRLRFTAATNGMKIQSLFNNANGAYTNLSGIEQ